MDLQQLNALSPGELRQQLSACCGARRWVEAMAALAPFDSEKTLVDAATRIWYGDCGEADWLEAFTHHPKIGDIESLRQKFAATQHLAGVEQSGVLGASDEVIESLASGNQAYEARFGFIFIVCATGKPAHEMLRLLQDRLPNQRPEELRVAMGEQHKITLIRLQKWLPDADWRCLKPSQITTHVLDTALGRPAPSLSICLQAQTADEVWGAICQGVTNADGRIGDLLPPNRPLPAGAYKMVFHTEAYFQAHALPVFYPVVEVCFQVFDDKHYHIPLLISPFGYSTYRGS